MVKKKRRLFTLLLIGLLCLSGCGGKTETLTDPKNMVSSGPGYPDVAAGRSYFYYKNCYGELYAVSAGNQKKTALGQGRLLGADQQYAYLWQENKLRVMDGVKQVAEFDYPLEPYYCATLNEYAYFNAGHVGEEEQQHELAILNLSVLELQRQNTAYSVNVMAAKGSQLYYNRNEDETGDLLICGYDRESGEEQIFSVLDRNVNKCKIFCIDERLYYNTDHAFYCYNLSIGIEQVLVQFPGQSNVLADYDSTHAWIHYTGDEGEHCLWLYDMAEERLISDEKSGLSISSNDFGLTFGENGKYWFEKETEKVDFKDQPIMAVCGSPAGLIVGTWGREVLIAFKKSEGGYRIQLVDTPF